MHTAARIAVVGATVALVLGCGEGVEPAVSQTPQHPAPSAEVVQHLAARLRVRVLGGFEAYDAILASVPREVTDELGRRDTELENTLTARTSAVVAEARSAARGWTEPTANDAIDAAFTELDAHGIIALQNAGYTSSDGWSDVPPFEWRRRYRPR